MIRRAFLPRFSDDPEGFFAPVFRHFQSGLDENYQIGTFYKAS